VPHSSPPTADHAVRRALRDTSADLERLPDPVTRIVAANLVMAAVDEELSTLAQIRIAAVHELRGLGWSLGRIAAATGLSKARVAQIARDDRAR